MSGEERDQAEAIRSPWERYQDRINSIPDDYVTVIAPLTNNARLPRSRRSISWVVMCEFFAPGDPLMKAETASYLGMRYSRRITVAELRDGYELENGCTWRKVD